MKGRLLGDDDDHPIDHAPATLAARSDALQVSTDELALGRKPSEAVAYTPIQNVVLLDRFRALQDLPRADQYMVVKLVDAVIANRRVDEALTQVRRRPAKRSGQQPEAMFDPQSAFGYAATS